MNHLGSLDIKNLNIIVLFDLNVTIKCLYFNPIRHDQCFIRPWVCCSVLRNLWQITQDCKL